MDYISLLMDVKKSQEYSHENRLELQIYMQSCVNILNKIYHKGIVHEVVINAGDSLQGLFYDLTTAFMYFRLLELLLHPVQIRAGIGIGAWDIRIHPEDVGLDTISTTQQDGQTYHRARKAIEEVYNHQFHNVRVCADCDMHMVNYLLNASSFMKNQQIYKQNQVLLILEVLYPFMTKSMGPNDDLQNIQLQNTQLPDTHMQFLKVLELKFNYTLGKKPKDNEDRINLDFAYKEMSKNCFDIQVEYQKFTQKGNKTHLMNYWIKLEKPEIMIDGKILPPEQCIMKKGMAEQVAALLGCTRQNAASIIKSGNAVKIREMDYMALQYLEQISND